MCDACNNYFARKVEKPFLDSPSICALRFYQEIPNKKGRIPSINGIISPGLPVSMGRSLEDPREIFLEIEPKYINRFLEARKENKGGQIILPADLEHPENKLPTNIPVSRFLAKSGLEYLASRNFDVPGGIDGIAEMPELDLLRNHARRGETPLWPYHERRIYAPNKLWSDSKDSSFQTLHELDFLATDSGESYFVLALFGLELVINLCGPSIDGYVQWLEEHNQVSPLYWGKNTDPTLRDA